MSLLQKTMKSEKVYEGKILNLRIDTVELPNKKYSKREIVEHSGAVAIVPIIDKDKLILIKQYRKAVEDYLYEIPAGRIEINEEPRETAIRELIEEIGYRPKKLTYLSEFYPSPGYTNEKIQLFLGEALIAEAPDTETEELIEVHEFTFDQVIKMIERNEIIDAKTIIGVYTAMNILTDN